MAELPRVFQRLADETAEQILDSLGETEKDLIHALVEYADEMNGHILTKTALDRLVPEWSVSEDTPGAEAVERFWALFRPLVIEELKLYLDPLRKPIKAEWDRRNKAVKEGRDW